MVKITFVCHICKAEKSVNEFSVDKQKKRGHRADCRSCNKEAQKFSRLTNPNYTKNSIEYKKINRDKVLAWKRKEHHKNKAKYKIRKRISYLQNVEKHAKLQKEYRKKNIQLLNKKAKERYDTDIQYKLSLNLRRRMHKLIKRHERKGSAVRDLGCSLEEFKLHIQSQFKDGMNWENYGKWHLDHIYPLSMVDLSNREEFLKVAHYTNYQPLWARDNIRKGNKISEAST